MQYTLKKRLAWSKVLSKHHLEANKALFEEAAVVQMFV
jgi:hypothetical protein